MFHLDDLEFGTSSLAIQMAMQMAGDAQKPIHKGIRCPEGKPLKLLREEGRSKLCVSFTSASSLRKGAAIHFFPLKG